LLDELETVTVGFHQIVVDELRLLHNRQSQKTHICPSAGGSVRIESRRLNLILRARLGIIHIVFGPCHVHHIRIVLRSLILLAIEVRSL
jgi:hypothetical protein